MGSWMKELCYIFTPLKLTWNLNIPLGKAPMFGFYVSFGVYTVYVIHWGSYKPFLNLLGHPGTKFRDCICIYIYIAAHI